MTDSSPFQKKQERKRGNSLFWARAERFFPTETAALRAAIHAAQAQKSRLADQVDAARRAEIAARRTVLKADAFERMWMMAESYMAGQTQAQIAEEWELTPQRVAEILAKTGIEGKVVRKLLDEEGK